MTEDTQKILDAMMKGFAGMNHEFEKMHARMTCVEERMDRMEDRMGKLEDRVGRIETDVRVIREILVEEKEISSQNCRDIALLKARAR